jgi:hypothetical protein
MIGQIVAKSEGTHKNNKQTKDMFKKQTTTNNNIYSNKNNQTLHITTTTKQALKTSQQQSQQYHLFKQQTKPTTKHSNNKLTDLSRLAALLSPNNLIGKDNSRSRNCTSPSSVGITSSRACERKTCFVSGFGFVRCVWLCVRFRIRVDECSTTFCIVRCVAKTHSQEQTRPNTFVNLFPIRTRPIVYAIDSTLYTHLHTHNHTTYTPSFGSPSAPIAFDVSSETPVLLP